MNAGLEHNIPALDARTCWSLLRSTKVGRIAVSTTSGPEIFPVNYIVDHATIVFRTADGTKLAAADENPPVAFEIDGDNQAENIAWSVIIKGRAEIIKRTHELIDTFTIPLFPWHTGPKPIFVRVVPDSLTGRRFRIEPAASWSSPLTNAPRAPLE